ncbi:MAG: bifunctional diguanylate cyclase/phosphodiesterase [gamma proteobacterium symbiont of Bathyaustriella thionipta]|nr:bifunctional diguanylate cyclase/phosphodiesterase [gamma proteobacterium symbiont of Bathyaustriella thionipta]MCU7950407.1 bifunctional diguanylate cyclase/phosphodiesterase [gamma proteobacterium symbiont of Bathyaustriella thionipta]MCU7953342.1 bifunctional diguanylate cyclase/phosphodiesterase [gamma proteobacterium symbiont of Bathyaustriella thionipta]MCU7956918.1 bifunctional diguanylate cyclase/phosphodiesterase [gamma proteobacterium symbiont of Bathyaustriella thionipta]MCU796814
MLKLISDKIKHSLKQFDIIARLGGDEFAVVLTDVSEKVAIRVAKRIINSLRVIETNVLGGAHKISVSIGIVLYPNDGFNVPDLLANADLAMYQAKEKKRGSFHLFSSQDQGRERVNQLMARKERIESAINEDRFILYFQPIMEITSGKIKRYETLIRMIDKNGDIQTPDSFIPEAEQLGMIGEIDRLVMKKAIQALDSFISSGFDLSLSVNLSGKAMDSPDILVLIQEQLQKYKVEPSRLVIEITETAAVSDIVGAERLMREIKELGCHFALDDFGVGFSSFFYLKQLPVDVVKLDGMFIRQLPHSDDDQVFVKALNDMAHGLGKQTVAEFVENEEILEMLAYYEVDYAQGYYIGRPLPDILR